MAFKDELSEILMVLLKQKENRGRAKARAKADAEKGHAAMQLLIDDLKEQGIDVNTQQGQTIIKLLLARRLSKIGGDSDYRADFSFD
jgi:hypothetical protein